MGELRTCNSAEIHMTDLWPDATMEITIIGVDKRSDEMTTFINKEQAIQIISHLQKEFSI